MKLKSSVFVFLIIIFLCVACTKKADDNALTVYCYDSFLGKSGAGEKIAKLFTEKTGIAVNLVGCGSASELGSRLIFEGKDCKADIVLGLSDENTPDASLFERLEEFDYGIFAFIYDTESTVQPPENLKDLASDYYKNKVILVDPRTSSVGLGLLKWTYYALGEEEALKWWQTMADNALTISSSWSSAYGIFTQGEAPFVISYTTSPVYHLLFEGSRRYQALEFSDGHVKSSEYAGILSFSKNKKNAELFLNFILNEGQVDLAVCNTMFPIKENTVLPDAFGIAIKPHLIPENGYFEENRSEILEKWTEAVSK